MTLTLKRAYAEAIEAESRRIAFEVRRIQAQIDQDLDSRELERLEALCIAHSERAQFLCREAKALVEGLMG